MMSHSPISTSELIASLSNPNVVLVDVRSVAAFNGWKLAGEERGGHIPGAIPFPLSWMEQAAGNQRIKQMIQAWMEEGRLVIVYGYGGDESRTMAAYLIGKGLEKVLCYEGGLMEWAADPSLPLNRLANYQYLVHPEWLKQLMSGQRPEAGPQGESLLFEVAWDGLAAYESSHIPGAHYLETTTFEGEPEWNRFQDEALAERLLTLGISQDKTIILYARDPMAATRMAVILLYAGVKEVRLLDGGFMAWERAGLPVESGVRNPRPAREFGPVFPARPLCFVDVAAVKEHLAADEAVHVSVRSWAEFTGQISGYPFIQAKGRIAGAVWGYGGSDPQHMESYRNGDQSMRSYHEIAAFWREQGITPDRKVIFSCGTGWRASEAYFCAHLMGWPKISVYDGGWLEWSSDKSNPVASGPM